MHNDLRYTVLEAWEYPGRYLMIERNGDMEQKLLAYLKEHEAEIFADLKELVLAEASTSDIDQLAHVREVLIRLIKERTGSDHLCLRGKGRAPIP